MVDDIELARRKERLVASVAAQRASLAARFRDLERPIAMVDRAVAATRFLREHPLLVGAVVAGVVAFRRRSLAGLITRGFAAWRFWRSLDTWSGRLGLAMRNRSRTS